MFERFKLFYDRLCKRDLHLCEYGGGGLSAFACIVGGGILVGLRPGGAYLSISTNGGSERFTNVAYVRFWLPCFVLAYAFRIICVTGT